MEFKVVHKGRVTLQVVAQDLENSLGALVCRSGQARAPVIVGAEYNLSRKSSETSLSIVREEDIVQGIGL